MKKTNSVDIIAPSSPPKGKRWRKGLKILESWGFQLHFSSQMLQPDFFHAHSNKKRSSFLKQAFSNKNSSIIWMLRGGYGFQKLIPSFKKDYLKFKQKKLFIGYSDGTVMHLFLNKNNQQTLHAPTVSELADLSQKELDTLKQILLCKKDTIVFDKLNSFKSYSKKTLTGKIQGGNLTLLATSIGTQKFPPFDFLFLEDIEEPAYKIDRFLYQLFYSGLLKSVKAVLFGDFYPLDKKSFQELLKSFSQVCFVPLIFNLPCGHRRKQPLPFNTPAQLSIQGSEASLQVKSF